MEWSDRRPIEDYEYPEPDDDDDEYDAIDCPHCGASIYEDVDQCPRCHNYVTHSSSPWTGKPAWWIILGVIGVVITLFALISL